MKIERHLNLSIFALLDLALSLDDEKSVQSTLSLLLYLTDEEIETYVESHLELDEDDDPAEIAENLRELRNNYNISSQAPETSDENTDPDSDSEPKAEENEYFASADWD